MNVTVRQAVDKLLNTGQWSDEQVARLLALLRENAQLWESLDQ